jgi:hypothetical protein
VTAATSPAVTLGPTHETVVTTSTLVAAPTDTVLTGTLSFPADVATTYTETATGGPIVVAGTWDAGRVLEIDVNCSGRRASQRGSGSATVALSAARGECTVVIAEPVGASWGTAYRMTVRPSPARP